MPYYGDQDLLNAKGVLMPGANPFGAPVVAQQPQQNFWQKVSSLLGTTPTYNAAGQQNPNVWDMFKTKDEQTGEKKTDWVAKVIPLLLSASTLTNPKGDTGAMLAGWEGGLQGVETQRRQKALEDERLADKKAAQERQDKLDAQGDWKFGAMQGQYTTLDQATWEKLPKEKQTLYKVGQSYPISDIDTLLTPPKPVKPSTSNWNALDQIKLEQQQKLISQNEAYDRYSGLESKYKTKGDYIGALKNNASALIAQMGADNYNDLLAKANALPDPYKGGAFKPGYEGAIESLLRGHKELKFLKGKNSSNNRGNNSGVKQNSGVTKSSNGGNFKNSNPIRTAQLKDKATGRLITAYYGVKDGQPYSTEAEARAH